MTEDLKTSIGETAKTFFEGNAHVEKIYFTKDGHYHVTAHARKEADGTEKLYCPTGVLGYVPFLASHEREKCEIVAIAGRDGSITEPGVPVETLPTVVVTPAPVAEQPVVETASPAAGPVATEPDQETQNQTNNTPETVTDQAAPVAEESAPVEGEKV